MNPNQIAEVETRLLRFIRDRTAEDVQEAFGRDGIGMMVLPMLPLEARTNILVAKNVKIFGGINPYVEDFIPNVAAGLARMAAGPQMEQTKAGQRNIVEVMLNQPGLSDENKQRLQASLQGELAAGAAAGGKRRKYSRKYCKKTRCRKMGFTQKASCRPYKNCFTRRVRRSGY